MSALLAYIPIGRAAAVSVADLVRAADLSDREVRLELARLLNDEHIPVCSLPIRRGIWIAETPEEADVAAEQLRCRAMSLLERCRALRLCRESLAWSPTLFRVP